MSSNIELVERLKARLERVRHTGARGYHLPVDAELDRAAAAQIEELEAKNALLLECLDVLEYVSVTPILSGYPDPDHFYKAIRKAKATLAFAAAQEDAA